MDTFIYHVNNISKSLKFYHGDAKIESDLVKIDCELHPLLFDILVNIYIATSLALYTEKNIRKETFRLF